VTAALLAVLLPAHPCPALINASFTPLDLAAAARRIVTVQPGKLAERALQIRAVRTVRGEGGLETFDLRVPDALAEEMKAALAGDPGAMLVLGDLGEAAAGPAGRKPSQAGALLVGTHWFGLRAANGGYRVVEDAWRLSEVWAGGAETLERLLREARNDRRLSVPVSAGVQWDRHALLSRNVPANVCEPVYLTPDGPPALFVASDAGDRLFAWDRSASKWADITQARKLRSRSRRAAWGDFTGDGRLDLASWDGKRLTVSAGGAYGALATPAPAGPLKSCLSLDAIGLAPDRCGLLVGTTDGPLLLRFGQEASRRTLAAPPKADEAGPCSVLDVDGDGRADVLQAWRNGLALHAGRPGGAFAPAKWGLKTPLAGALGEIDVGDFDNDERLDVLLTGSRRARLLAGAEDGRFRNVHAATGEVAYHLKTGLRGAAVGDINTDGRQDLIFLYDGMIPQVFFNRGQRCFGLAVDLALTPPGTDEANIFGEGPDEKPHAGADARSGQTAGAWADFDGDGGQDLALATSKGPLWVVHTKRPPRKPLTLRVLAPGTGPIRLTAVAGKRSLGARLARPGAPALFCPPAKGPLTVRWTGAEDRPRRRPVIMLKPATLRIEDSPKPRETQNPVPHPPAETPPPESP
jgi:hypothetical protein